MIILLVAWLACGFFCSAIAGAKGRDRTGWFFLGLLFPLLSLIAIAGMPAKPQPTVYEFTPGLIHVKTRNGFPVGKALVFLILGIPAAAIALSISLQQPSVPSRAPIPSASSLHVDPSRSASLPAPTRPVTLDAAAQQQGFADFADMTKAQAAGYRSAVEWHGHLLANQQNPATAPVAPAKKKTKAAHASPVTPLLASDH